MNPFFHLYSSLPLSKKALTSRNDIDITLLGQIVYRTLAVRVASGSSSNADGTLIRRHDGQFLQKPTETVSTFIYNSGIDIQQRARFSGVVPLKVFAGMSRIPVPDTY
jgi:hypothetical protein